MSEDRLLAPVTLGGSPRLLLTWMCELPPCDRDRRTERDHRSSSATCSKRSRRAPARVRPVVPLPLVLPMEPLEPIERVESPCHDQPLNHRAADLGAMPEVGEGEVRLASYTRWTSASLMPLTSPGTVGCRSPPIGKVVDNLPLNGSALTQASANPFHPVALARGVDVQPEDRDTQVACVVQDQPFGVHNPGRG